MINFLRVNSEDISTLSVSSNRVRGGPECTTCPSGEYSDTRLHLNDQVSKLCMSFRKHCDVPVHCWKSSEVGSWECFDCDFMFVSPKTAIFLLPEFDLSILIIVVVATKRYKKQDRIKQKLRIDLHRQRQLVKTKQMDIKLMTGTYLFLFIFICFRYPLTIRRQQQQVHGNYPPREVKLEEKLASGAYGEVWKGALHDRWIVAIKKLFPRQLKSPSVSKRSSVQSSKSKKFFGQVFQGSDSILMI